MSKRTALMTICGLIGLAGLAAAIKAQDKPPIVAPDNATIVQAAPDQAPAVVQVEPGKPGGKLSDKDRASAEKELRDLESQRAKLDSRISEVRRKLGRYEWSFAMPNIALRLGEGWRAREMTPEQRAQFEKDMARAREDMRRATEEMQRAIRENLGALRGRSFFEVPSPPVAPRYRVVPEQDAGVRAQIEELRREIEKLRDEVRSQRAKPEQKSGPV